MKIKNLIPYYLANQLFEYNSKYIKWIKNGYIEEIKKHLLLKDYYLGELELIYYMSINHKKIEILKFFDDNIKIDKAKKSYAYQAAEMNYPYIVQNYLLKVKPKKTSKFLLLLLKIATLHSSKESIEVLLEYGIDFKQDNYECIRSVLSAGNFEIFKIYHKYGLNIKKDEYIYTAILKDNKEWFQYLINNGFEVTEKNKEAIYNFMGFNGSLIILEEEKNNIIDKKEIMFTSSRYNPLAKKWFDSFFKKVDFYKKLEEKMPPKENTKIEKVKKI